MSEGIMVLLMSHTFHLLCFGECVTLVCFTAFNSWFGLCFHLESGLKIDKGN